MIPENLSLTRLLNILAWVVLGLGVVGVVVVFFLNPLFTFATLLPLILTLLASLILFVTLIVLARILKTVTHLYQLSWEQFKELGDDIDDLDGKHDGSDGPQCAYCGALIDPSASVCGSCGKPYSTATQAAKQDE